MARVSAALLLVVLALVAAGCGRDPAREGASRIDLAVGGQASEAQDLGFPELATKNTTRVGGSDATVVAAGVARAVFPGPGRQAQAVALVDDGDWRTAVAAAALAAPPVHAPLLFTHGKDIPQATSSALGDLAPTGDPAVGGGQVIRVGAVPSPKGLKTTDVQGATPFARARAIAGLMSAARGNTATSALIVNADAPAYAMPAAAYAAESGDPVLFVTKDTVPPDTLAALAALQQPRIYVLGPSTVISPRVTRRLRKLGRVARTGGPDPVTNAIAFARYRAGAFGWSVTDPGHGLLFARSDRPLDAAAASSLSASGTYGPLLLLDRGDQVPTALHRYLLDIQPGYEDDPTRGVYNHGWVVGDTRDISVDTQARLDALLEIAPVRTPDATHIAAP